MNYAFVNRWLEKSDKWQLQSLRAKMLNIDWEQYDKYLDCTYHSYEELARKVEDMKNLLKELKS